MAQALEWLLLAVTILMIVPCKYVLSFSPQSSQQSTFSSHLQCLRSSISENNERRDFGQIKFLGSGSSAIVRPGVVLVAPKEEFHHFYREAAIFIYAMGEDDLPGDGESKEYLIRGVIIDHPTPFTFGEMSSQSVDVQGNPLEHNLISRGGDKGGDSVFMLHNQPSIGNGKEIGDSGIYEGGLAEALDACQQGRASPEVFKFFFNFCQFTELELESMLEDDPWISLEVPPEMVLSQEWDRGDCWKQLRNALRNKIRDN